MARKAEKTVTHGKAKGVKARSGQQTGSTSHGSGSSSVKGSAKSSGTGSLGKATLKGCLPTSIMIMMIIIAAIIIL